MKKLPLLAALAATVLTLSACSDGGTAPAAAEDNNTNNTEDAAPELPGIGEKVEGDGLAMTIDYVTLTADLDEVTDTSGFLEDKATVAREGATFALVGATVENTGNSSLSPSCGGDVRTNLYVDERSYESQSDQQFSLNYEGSCTVDLGPGLTETAIYAFEIPEDAEPTEFGFSRNDQGERGQETLISLADYESKSERNSDGPNPTLSSSSPAETTTTQTTATGTTTTPTQESAASSPAYGASCSAGQAGMPATGPDGSTLVCTGMGASGFSWVYGPAPRGAGTAELGGECTDGEQGGQDAQGRMLLCSNGQWYSGP